MDAFEEAPLLPPGTPEADYFVRPEVRHLISETLGFLNEAPAFGLDAAAMQRIIQSPSPLLGARAKIRAIKARNHSKPIFSEEL